MTKASLFATSCLLLVTGATSFTVAPSHHHALKKTTPLATTLYAKKTTEIPKSGEGNIFDTNFSGGYFEKETADAEAVKIASKIRSVKDLGWTNSTPKRKGNTRPRHRAWGGEGEEPIQFKSNYDETKENCPEKWLTLEELYTRTRSSGAAADTVFVALAGGAKYAERDVCEAKIEQWKVNGKFDEDAFLKSVAEGRKDLAVGWGTFVGLNLFFASCIAFPTNPAAKALEGAIASLQGAGLSQ